MTDYIHILKYNCYSNDKLCNSISSNKNGLCDNCNIKYINISDSELLTRYNKLNNKIIEEIRTYLNIQDTLTRTQLTEKAINILIIMDFILKNLYFLFENKKFLNVLIDRCIVLSDDIKIFTKTIEQNTYYNLSKLFIENIAKNFKQKKYNPEENIILEDFEKFIVDFLDKYYFVKSDYNYVEKIIIDL
jgi:hypothetical protein